MVCEAAQDAEGGLRELHQKVASHAAEMRQELGLARVRLVLMERVKVAIAICALVIAVPGALPWQAVSP